MTEQTTKVLQTTIGFFTIRKPDLRSRRRIWVTYTSYLNPGDATRTPWATGPFDYVYTITTNDSSISEDKDWIFWTRTSSFPFEQSNVYPIESPGSVKNCRCHCSCPTVVTVLKDFLLPVSETSSPTPIFIRVLDYHSREWFHHSLRLLIPKGSQDKNYLFSSWLINLRLSLS